MRYRISPISLSPNVYKGDSDKMVLHMKIRAAVYRISGGFLVAHGRNYLDGLEVGIPSRT